LAHYGYQDAAGEFFIRIDTDRCSGCGDCAGACPAQLFEVIAEDPNDPLRAGPVAVVSGDLRNRLKYACHPCKPAADRPPLPCVAACASQAIRHSW
jgi:ferredoxin